MLQALLDHQDLLAPLDQLDLLVLLVPQASQALQEPLDLLEILEHLVWQVQLAILELQVVRAQEDQVVHRGLLVILVQLVLLDRRASLVALDNPDLWGPLVLLGLLEHQVSLDLQGRWVTQVTLACRDRREQQVQLGRQVCLDALEIPVPLVTPVLVELLGYRAVTVNREPQEIQVQWELLEKWEQVVRQALQEVQVTLGPVGR